MLLILITSLLAAGIAWSQEETEPPAAEQPPYMDQYIGADAEMIGVEQCLMCHPGRLPASPFAHIAYIELDPSNPNAGFACEACHGPGGNHMGNPAGIINPKKLDIDQVTDLCSKCHSDLRSFSKDDWYASEHYYADISCLDCHGGHSENEFFLVNEDQLELCYTCHAEKRAEFGMRSHHPVEEGQLGCFDCHNVHSGTYDWELNADGDELCYGCHADKEGPFVYDHDVSRASGGDGCMTCHFAHGANSDNLLRYPHRVCLECHTDITPANHFSGTCWSTGCHVEIHGSNSHPLFFY
jgi:DmsE family decaheme c-type cytochrome